MPRRTRSIARPRSPAFTRRGGQKVFALDDPRLLAAEMHGGGHPTIAGGVQGESRLRLSPGRVLVKSAEQSDGMKRGTPAQAPSSTPCRSMMTSCSPLSAETTHAASSHPLATEPASATSAGATIAPIPVSRSVWPADASRRTSVRTAAPRATRAFAIRAPKSPAAPASTMGD